MFCCRRKRYNMNLDPGMEDQDVIDNSEWMTNLPENLHNVPLKSLSIPGSHDSFTYNLDKSGPIAPSTPAAIKDLAKIFGSLVKDIIYKWSVTQALDATGQLKAGIRYFDIRTSTKPGSDDFFAVHGLYGDCMETIFAQLLYFLEEHPKEVIFLDFNHFYCMSDVQHGQFIDIILEFFGSKMCPPMNMNDLTLDYLWERNLQVLTFYSYPKLVMDYTQLWPGDSMISPWLDQVSVSKQIDKLEKEYEKGHPRSSFFVFQGVLTPDTSYILSHLTESLKGCLCDKIATPFVKWVDAKTAGPKGINICLSDFAQDAFYIASVLELNMKFSKVKSCE